MVRERREELGLDRETLAVRAGLSFSTIGRLERGSEPSLETLKALAPALEMELGDLIAHVGTAA